NRRGYRELYGVDPHYRHLFSRCNIGYLNVCGARRAFDVRPNGDLEVPGFAELEVLISRMVDSSLYALAVSELRSPGSGTVDLGGGFLLVYQGSPGEGLWGGCGFILSPGAARAWRDNGSRASGKSSGRMLCISLRLAGDEGCFHLVSVYGPAMQRPEAEKDEFWDELQSVWQALPAREPAWILADFNSRIGINTAAAPSPAAEGVHGPYGLGQLNTNGERFLHFCSEAHLKVLSTFFQRSADELTSWVHRRWGTQGMIDYAVGRATDWCYVLDAHSLPHAEVNSDHRLMVLKLHAAPGRYVRAAPTATCDKRLLRLCVAKLQEGDTSTQYVKEVERLRQGEAQGFPSLFHDLYQAGVSVLGTVQRRTSDWRDGHEATLRAAGHSHTPSTGSGGPPSFTGFSGMLTGAKSLVELFGTSRLDGGQVACSASKQPLAATMRLLPLMMLRQLTLLVTLSSPSSMTWSNDFGVGRDIVATVVPEKAETLLVKVFNGMDLPCLVKQKLICNSSKADMEKSAELQVGGSYTIYPSRQLPALAAALDKLFSDGAPCSGVDDDNNNYSKHGLLGHDSTSTEVHLGGGWTGACAERVRQSVASTQCDLCSGSTRYGTGKGCILGPVRLWCISMKEWQKLMHSIYGNTAASASSVQPDPWSACLANTKSTACQASAMRGGPVSRRGQRA
ncbi:CFDP2, partial [Symbiodinium microadriaticum]